MAFWTEWIRADQKFGYEVIKDVWLCEWTGDLGCVKSDGAKSVSSSDALRYACFCMTSYVFTCQKISSPSKPNSIGHKRTGRDLSLLPSSRYKEGNDINNLKDNSSEFVSLFMVCQQQTGECSVASIHEYLTMQLCIINFSERKVMDWAPECMVKCGCIKCMGIHSPPRNVTTANGLADFSSELEGPITVTLV